MNTRMKEKKEEKSGKYCQKISGYKQREERFRKQKLKIKTWKNILWKYNLIKKKKEKKLLRTKRSKISEEEEKNELHDPIKN